MTAMVLLTLLLGLGWLANRLDYDPRPYRALEQKFPPLEATPRDLDCWASTPRPEPRAGKNRPARVGWKPRKVQV